MGANEREHELALVEDRVRDLEAQALADRVDIEHLHIALETARRIGAAIGIIMMTRKVTEDEAFKVLRVASQNTNQKLRALADDVVATGEVPSEAARSQAV